MEIKPVDQCVALSVANTSHAAVTVGANASDNANKAAFLNTGSTVIAVTVTQKGASKASVLPVDGTPSISNIVLPASMVRPVVYRVPTMPFDVTAIGSAAGPSIVYITPCE